MKNDIEFDLAFQHMRDVADYYVNHLYCCGLGILNYFIQEREKFEALCKLKSCRVEWFSLRDWDSLGCSVVAIKKGAPYGVFTVQGHSCLALNPLNY